MRVLSLYPHGRLEGESVIADVIAATQSEPFASPGQTYATIHTAEFSESAMVEQASRINSRVAETLGKKGNAAIILREDHIGEHQSVSINSTIMPTKNNGRTQPVAGRATITKLVDPLTDVPYKNRSAVGISSRAIAKDRNFIGNGRHHAMINLSPTSDAPILVPGINSNYLLKTGRERVVQAATPALAAVAAIIRRVEEVFARIGAPFTRNVISAQVRSKILGDEGKGLGSNNIDQHQQLNRILPGISSKIDLDIGELQREAFMKIAVVFQLIPAEETKWHEISGIFGDESDPASEGLELTGVLKSNTRHEAREDESNQLARIIGISLENTPGLEVVTEGDKTTVKLSVVNLRANFARMILRTHDSMAPHFPKKRIATPPIPEVTQA